MSKLSKHRAGLVRIVILLSALILVYVTGLWIRARRSGAASLEGEIERVHQLAAAEDPSLATILDQSMVHIATGEFLMGSDRGRDDERPPRQVYLDAYEIDRYEVTNAQYRRFVQATAHRPPRHWTDGDYPPHAADLPVVGVGWEDADAYCRWVGKRLPTEAEWEKACRGTDGRTYPWGDLWRPNRANVGRPSDAAGPEVWEQAWSVLQVESRGAGAPGLRPVGSYPNGAGLYGTLDMVGNASEWVWDWYNWAGYQDLPARNPRGTGPPWNRSLRGSAWLVPYGGRAQRRDQSRCAARRSSHAADGDPRTGFRCARSVVGIAR